ncbi:CPBP family intramembrane glutamic endopeptidase [Marimonas arenosa]|uniref:CPBP family intramembrane metalloprotease n=1 Tax=Marimonas arenosa TaxID=1795305 RepID=A0AAE4B555_9RHOB|nr:type II CAAX endopeptidase family protein [Marimonas arenosa]MDQ2090920.1 CPBP family intramembrane metalloprotease [Marimonas arenosa]
MTRRTAYAAHTRFVAPALGTPGARPVILGFIIVESLYRMGQQLLGYLLEAIDPEFAAAVFDGSTPAGLLVNLGSFVILALCLALTLHWVHGRRMTSLLGPIAQLWPQARATFGAVMLVFVAFEALTTGFAVAPGTIIRPLPDWLLLLIPGLAVLLIQISSEEMFYRGYLQQQIAALAPHPAAWLILPNVAFAVAHISPYAAFEENLAYLTWTFCFGLAASDLTARAGTLGPALGLHFANNAYAFLLYGEAGGLDSGLALVLYPAPDPGMPGLEAAPTIGLLPELAILAVTWGAARLALRR